VRRAGGEGSGRCSDEQGAARQLLSVLVHVASVGRDGSLRGRRQGRRSCVAEGGNDRSVI
jgi:hypothetical protein